MSTTRNTRPSRLIRHGIVAMIALSAAIACSETTTAPPDPSPPQVADLPGDAGMLASSVLIRPFAGATIQQNNPNIGCPANASYGYGFRIKFRWHSVYRAKYYVLFAEHQGAIYPIVNRSVSDTSFTYTACNSYVASFNATNWFWKVGAVRHLPNTNRDTTVWTPPRAFQFSPFP